MPVVRLVDKSTTSPRGTPREQESCIGDRNRHFRPPALRNSSLSHRVTTSPTHFPKGQVRHAPHCAVATSVASLVLLAIGCTHTQLRWNTVRQSRTLTDIYEQQVLNNLAMFVYDPNSLPFFSFPNAGASNVNDVGGFTGAFKWPRRYARARRRRFGPQWLAQHDRKLDDDADHRPCEAATYALRVPASCRQLRDWRDVNALPGLRENAVGIHGQGPGKCEMPGEVYDRSGEMPVRGRREDRAAMSGRDRQRRNTTSE